jgi:phosphonate transport system ATP-binding protein
MAGEILFDLHKASASYDGQPALIDVDLTICAGECVAVMGRSGAGKSTLIGLLYAERPGDIALVPQAAALVKQLSVFHNVYMGRLDRHSTAYNLRTLVWPAHREIEEVSAVLSSVGLAEKIFVPAGALSGGQQQRTSVARALFNGCAILLGDEPVSALDRVQGREVLALLKRCCHTMVLALHDMQLALELTDRIVVLDHGRKVIDAPAASLTAKDLLSHFEAEP